MKISNSNSKDNMSMSTQELIKELKEAEKVLFDLRFKKATRQPFKPHEIKATKKKVAILKTILRSKFLD
jgi:large subunit ribosomal protein L29|uniref:Large ribosomal subunit protein uL29c n=1 Tax=Stephanodiscus hantzschii f. tenuis TaxID=3145218 RepID=A0AB74TKS9_9STRA